MFSITDADPLRSGLFATDSLRRLDRPRGRVPEKALDSNPRTAKKAPELLRGKLGPIWPDRVLLPRRRKCRYLILPKDSGKVDVNLLFCNEADFNFRNDPKLAGIGPLSRFENKVLQMNALNDFVRACM